MWSQSVDRAEWERVFTSFSDRITFQKKSGLQSVIVKMSRDRCIALHIISKTMAKAGTRVQEKDQDESMVRNGASDQPWQCPAAWSSLSGVLCPPPVGTFHSTDTFMDIPWRQQEGNLQMLAALTWERDWISLVEIQEADKQHLLPESVKERCDKKPTFIGSLLYVGHSANYLLSCEMLPKLIRYLLLPPFYRWENWAMQKLNSSPGSSGDLRAIFEQRD